MFQSGDLNYPRLAYINFFIQATGFQTVAYFKQILSLVNISEKSSYLLISAFN